MLILFLKARAKWDTHTPDMFAAITQVHGALWSRVLPTRVPNPRLLAYSQPLANELGIDRALMGVV